MSCHDSLAVVVGGVRVRNPINESRGLVGGGGGGGRWRGGEESHQRVMRTCWCVVGSMVLVVREDKCDSPMNHRDSLVVVVVDEGQGR